MGSEPQRFRNKVVMITGAAGDIGLAVARALALEGARLALCDLREAELRRAENELSEAGTEVVGLVCDVTSAGQVEETVKQAVSRFGGIHHLFNNAGYQGDFRPTFQYPVDDFERVLAINVVGVFSVLSQVAQVFVKQQMGSVVNTASGAGLQGPPNMVAYASSKAAVIGMTRTAAKDLAPYNVRVNAISPALIGPGTMWERQVRMQAQAGTEYYNGSEADVAAQMISRVPMRRLGTLQEIASTVLFLLSDESSYITGANIPISGGLY